MTTFTVKDNNKAIIGSTVNSDDHPIGYAMDDGTSYSFSSKLPNPLIVTGEHEHDDVQFTYGSLSWQSKQMAVAHALWEDGIREMDLSATRE